MKLNSNSALKGKKSEMIRILLALCIIVTFASACPGPPSSREESNAATESSTGIIRVATAKAEIRNAPSYFQATGSFIAEELSDVAPSVGGRVAATPVEIGDFVRKGQAICILEKLDAQLRFDQARAIREQARYLLSQAQSRVGWSGEGEFNPELVPEVASSWASYESALATAKLAEADAQRYENLVKSGDVSLSNYERYKTQQQTAAAAAESSRKQYEAQVNTARQNFRAIEAAEASLASAESQLAQAEKGLEDTTIRAPFDGHITSRPVSVGQWVGTNNYVATLESISTLRLQLQIPEQRATEVKTGMTVTARVAAYSNLDFIGKVHAVVPSVDSNSRTFTVEAQFDNLEELLRPGMFASAKLMLEENEQAVFVPLEAVFYDSTTDSNNIYSVVDGVARLNVVLKGDTEGNQVRILTGLKGTEVVVIDNLSKLYDGAPVETQS